MAWKVAELMGTPSMQNAVPTCQACSEVEDQHGYLLPLMQLDILV